MTTHEDFQRALPETVQRGLRMLKEAEPIAEAGLRAQRFREAVGILNKYMTANPDSPAREFVQNVKAAYVRRHVQVLSAEPELDLVSWFQNFVLFSIAEKELEAVLEKCPELRPWSDAFFVSTRREEINRLLEHPR
jgi:hypothetical protein